MSHKYSFATLKLNVYYARKLLDFHAQCLVSLINGMLQGIDVSISYNLEALAFIRRIFHCVSSSSVSS
jgi:hypothetical protein